jgi:hypothetical protein
MSDGKVLENWSGVFEVAVACDHQPAEVIGDTGK